MTTIQGLKLVQGAALLWQPTWGTEVRVTFVHLEPKVVGEAQKALILVVGTGKTWRARLKDLRVL